MSPWIHTVPIRSPADGFESAIDLHVAPVFKVYQAEISLHSCTGKLISVYGVVKKRSGSHSKELIGTNKTAGWG